MLSHHSQGESPGFGRVDRVSIAPSMKTVQLGTPEHLRDSARRARKQVKGRVPDVQALVVVRSVLGEALLDGYPQDLLIEHLHLLQDAHGALHKAHLVALAQR